MALLRASAKARKFIESNQLAVLIRSRQLCALAYEMERSNIRKFKRVFAAFDHRQTSLGMRRLLANAADRRNLGTS
jgi:hypothetical protein